MLSGCIGGGGVEGKYVCKYANGTLGKSLIGEVTIEFFDDGSWKGGIGGAQYGTWEIKQGNRLFAKTTDAMVELEVIDDKTLKTIGSSWGESTCVKK